MAHQQRKESAMQRYTPREEDYTVNLRSPASGDGKRGILLQRTKTIKSGDYMEAEIFPVVMTERGIREERRKRTPEQIRIVNERNAVKRLERLMHCNFGEGDLMPHLTMDRTCTFGDMQRTVRMFFQRLRRLAKKRGAELRYIYVIETKQEHGQQRHHLHGLINGGWITRDEVEKIWGNGLSRVDRVQEQQTGLRGFARYITRQKSTQERLMHRRWGCSKGLKQPTVTTADRKFSRAACARIAAGVEADARAIFEKKYPGYRLAEQPVIRWSEWLPGCYIYAMMVRRGCEG